MTFSPISVGKLLALIVVVLSVVLLIIGHISLLVGALLCLLALGVVLL